MPLLALLAALAPAPQGSFVNWETPHVHPLELTPDRARLLAVNLADARLEVLDVTTGTPVAVDSIPVGLDPVSVRARTSGEAWVVNRISDSVSVVDLASGRVRATLAVEDEPADVVFAGSPQRAFVSCSATRGVLVFDPADLAAPPQRVPIAGQQPRALARSADGSRVYVAVFESGNRTTVLGSGGIAPGDFPPDVMSLAIGPWGGQNPPPNEGAGFEPPLAPGLPPPPNAGLIVRLDGAGRWKDDNGGDWTSFVSGPQAAFSGRRPGWTLADNDVAILDASTLSVSYAKGLMNLCMALAVQPGTGRVTVVGTDATNEVRYEPNLRGRFLRVRLAAFDPATPPPASAASLVDLNPHLDYASGSAAPAQRALSIADPRAIVWNGAGTRAWIAGLGSDRVVAIDGTGARVGAPIVVGPVGAGPTGLALDEPRGRLYVLARFAAEVAAVDLASASVVRRVRFHDSTPAAVREGREYLYDARRHSGLGITACAACHPDARMDRLAWDLGDPSAAVEPLGDANLGGGLPEFTGFVDFHPMKGPMVTPPLIDIVGHEPFHWRGDRTGIEAFNPAYPGLLGADAELDSADMQALEDFLATIHYPPNPNRALDGSLRADLPLPGHFTTGRFAPAGQPLPNGDATRGRALFDSPAMDCRGCHTLPTGMGTGRSWDGASFQPIPPGPDGEAHLALHPPVFKIPQNQKIANLRALYLRHGADYALLENTAGFGYRHDGAIDSLARFVSRIGFDVGSDQDVADLVAFLYSMSGELEPNTAANDPNRPPGTAGQATHAAVGRQLTLASPTPAAAQLAVLEALLALAEADAIGLVAKGRAAGLARGAAYIGGGTFQSDRAAETLTLAALLSTAAPGAELTFTAVPSGSERRLGIDRDGDRALDRDELDAGSDPADPRVRPRLRAR